MNRFFRFPSLIAFCGALLLLGLVGAASSQAAMIGYTARISESLQVLKNPGNSNIAAMAALQSQLQLMTDRNMPFIELTNTAVESEITTLSVTIGDTNFVFDFAKLVEASPGVTVSVTQGDTLSGGVKTPELKLAFTGLTPGKFVRFRTDIDPVAGNQNQLVDYRQVMFDLNGGDDSDNSEVAVTFAAQGFLDTTLTGPLEDFALASPTQLALSCRTPVSTETVTSFTLSQTGTQLVPEPSGIALAGLGGAGALCLIFRRRAKPARNAS